MLFQCGPFNRNTLQLVGAVDSGLEPSPERNQVQTTDRAPSSIYPLRAPSTSMVESAAFISSLV